MLFPASRRDREQRHVPGVWLVQEWGGPGAVGLREGGALWDEVEVQEEVLDVGRERTGRADGTEGGFVGRRGAKMGAP